MLKKLGLGRVVARARLQPCRWVKLQIEFGLIYRPRLYQIDPGDL